MPNAGNPAMARVMAIDLIVEDARWGAIDLSGLAGAACEAALVRLSLDPDHWQIAILACDDARIAKLNEDFRGRSGPTNVLSWPSEVLAP